MRKFIKKTLFILTFGMIYLSPNLVKTYGQTFKEYPKTYDEAIDKVIDILDDKTKNTIRTIPRFGMREFDQIIFENDLLDYKDSFFRKSCAENIGAENVHFDDVTYVILQGVWDKLNRSSVVVNFDTIETENYFDAIQETLNKIKNQDRLGIITSLPGWLFLPRKFFQNTNVERNQKLVQIAKQLVLNNDEKAYLGLLFISCANENFEETKIILDAHYQLENRFFEMPSFDFVYNNPNSESKELKGISYTFTKTSFKALTLRCYEGIFNKKFTSYAHYDQFIISCNTNYLMYWKYLNTLATEDYKTLLNEPKKLLEILILTNKYYDSEALSGYFYFHNDKVNDLIQLIEIKEPISIINPFPKRLQAKNYVEDDSTIIALNALKIITNKLSIEELIDIINPKLIEYYNQNFKTENLLDYKILAGFIIALEYEKLLQHPDKNKVFDNLYFYFKNEHISYPFNYFIADLLIQIDNEKAVEIFKNEFEDNPTEGNFNRHGFLAAIIEYDFENNAQFIENWYWKVQGIEFNYSPKEHKFILELLKNKNDRTLALFHKIILDKRYRD